MDAGKCFDKLWLDEGIIDMWKSGMKARDCILIKRMNEKADVVIETPIGKTKEIQLENIVRQGTVSGPAICGATMDQVNNVGIK